MWWLWIVLGLVLSVLELVTPGGFYIIFFGVSALFVGVVAGLGLAGPGWAQWLLFTALSLGGVLLVRRPLLRRLGDGDSREDVDSLLGELAVPVETIAPGAVGRVELRGTTWSARGAGTTPLLKGERCRVRRVDGLLLVVEPESRA